ncbi:hypothetical protein ACKGJN_11435 [Gillisia sp. Q332]|uniref:hypothetical protein n=1 Tax=Gillisia xinjiangensis TaxID=3384765 RepID=UPI00391B9750
MKFKRLITIVLFLFLILSLTSCVPAGVTEYEYGFFGGCWHGFIATFSFIGQLFGADIGIMAETHNGVPYYIGWVIGILLIGVLSLGRL